MRRKFREWYSIKRAKNPSAIVLIFILLLNILFIMVSATFLSNMPLENNKDMGFFEAAYSTVTMILDAGCISNVIKEVGEANVVLAIGCLIIVMLGMVIFTGAVIGYVTNYISSFIENTNGGTKPVHVSNHVVVLNWNTRASEIINDLLFYNKNKEKQVVIVLVNSNKEEIEKEIAERLSDTVKHENKKVKEAFEKLPWLKRKIAVRKNRFKNTVSFIVREGDVFSAMQLHAISLEQARSIIILGNDVNNMVCKYEKQGRLEESEKGNSQTIKTLMQVADITAADDSADRQKIIVEITDDWTWALVDKIIKRKEKGEKCNIVPVRVNQVLGQILAQFSLMPELNLAYSDLFSNKGDTFFTAHHEKEPDDVFIPRYLESHRHAIPLAIMESRGKHYGFFAAEEQDDIQRTSLPIETDYSLKLNKEYWIERKNIIILGHNSKFDDIMQGFESFFGEWSYTNQVDENGKKRIVDKEDDILHVVVVDEKANLEKMDFDKYHFSVKPVAASIYDRDIIYKAINDFIDSNIEDTSILILSDDTAVNEEIDSKALANLVYVQDIVKERVEKGLNTDVESMDIVVEIVNPKHHEIVKSYSVNNVVISNRYISKMMTQIGEKEELFNFYTDILHYDSSDESDADAQGVEDVKDVKDDNKEEIPVYSSKEIYIKKVDSFFDELPAPSSAYEFVRALYAASVDPSIPVQKRNPTIALGYVKPGGKMFLFCGDQAETKVELEHGDKLIVFSNH